MKTNVYIPPRFIEENIHLPKDTCVQIGDKLYVDCIYPYIFAFEKDFNKALDECCNFALNKINRRINQIV